jgi:hypothetical protein
VVSSACLGEGVDEVSPPSLDVTTKLDQYRQCCSLSSFIPSVLPRIASIYHLFLLQPGKVIEGKKSKVQGSWSTKQMRQYFDLPFSKKNTLICIEEKEEISELLLKQVDTYQMIVTNRRPYKPYNA